MAEARIVISLSDVTVGEEIFSKIEQILEEHAANAVHLAFLESKDQDSFVWKVHNKWEPSEEQAVHKDPSPIEPSN